MTKENYLEMCNSIGSEPNKDEEPIEFSDFPAYIQVAIYIHNILESKFDGNTGYYIGKDYTMLSVLFDSYDIIEPKDKLDTINIIKMVDSITQENFNSKQEVRLKKANK